jgi:hypothetical protein
MRDVTRKITTILVLANYLLAFVAGECLHHHRHQAGAPQECALADETRVASAGCGCGHARHYGRPTRQQELCDSRHCPAVGDAHACAVCQFLAQKFLSPRPIHTLTHQDLRDRIQGVLPPLPLAVASFSWHSRAPPVA